ncbi:MAG: hypothetical protein Q9227_007072 [Pyrenula ochraceoflavens]
MPGPPYNLTQFPLVGISLSHSYATAALLRPNDGIRTFYASADDIYVDTMRKLSAPSARHFHPPYRNVFEKFVDAPCQAARRLREQLALHASSEVSTIHTLIRALRDKMQIGYVPTIGPVVIVRPKILALYDEDILDAVKFNGFLEKESDLEEIVLAKEGCAMVDEMKAVAVESGSAIHAHPIEDRRSPGPRQTFLSILYTKLALHTHIQTFGEAFDCTSEYDHPEDNFRLSWDLGSESSLANSPDYWFRVGSFILDLPLAYQGKSVAKVLLYGESANSTIFRHVVKEAMARLDQDNEPEVMKHEDVYVAARGALEFARQIAAR